MEQEIEHIREGQRMLEASSNRREKLEAALRAKMEKQVRNLRGEIIHLKGENLVMAEITLSCVLRFFIHYLSMQSSIGCE